jgi:hypothetical protein
MSESRKPRRPSAARDDQPWRSSPHMPAILRSRCRNATSAKPATRERKRKRWLGDPPSDRIGAAQKFYCRRRFDKASILACVASSQQEISRASATAAASSASRSSGVEASAPVGYSAPSAQNIFCLRSSPNVIAVFPRVDLDALPDDPKSLHQSGFAATDVAASTTPPSRARPFPARMIQGLVLPLITAPSRNCSAA